MVLILFITLKYLIVCDNIIYLVTKEALTNTSKKPTSPAIIAAAVIVPVLLILIATIIGIAVYKCYRRKYPVRMVIGKNFSKFENPKYTKKTSTLTLVRDVKFDVAEAGDINHGGHDNPALDVDYINLQPTHMGIIADDSSSITEIDEVPIKMPRRKKRISVMSTESVDGKVMSAFLQEALDEVDSEGENLEKDTKQKKKISVDAGLRKNVSRVSVDSENGSQTDKDEHNDDKNTNVSEPDKIHLDSEVLDEKKKRSQLQDENESQDESISGHSEPDEYYTNMQMVKQMSSDTTEDNYEEMNTTTVDDHQPDKSDCEGSDDYDIVDVDPMEINITNEQQKENPTTQSFDKDRAIPEDYICDSNTKTENSSFETNNAAVGEIVEQMTGDDVSFDNNYENYVSEKPLNNTDNKDIQTVQAGIELTKNEELLVEESGNSKIKVEYSLNEDDDVGTDEESSVSVDSYSFAADNGSVKDSDHKDSSNSLCDDSSVAENNFAQTLESIQINNTTNESLVEERTHISCSYSFESENDDSVTSEADIDQKESESLRETDNLNNDDIIVHFKQLHHEMIENNNTEVMDPQFCSKSDDELIVVSGDINSNRDTNSYDSMETSHTKDDALHFAIEETTKEITKQSEDQSVEELPVTDTCLTGLQNDKDNGLPFANHLNETDEINRIDYVPKESDDESDSINENTTIPPLPTTLPPNFELLQTRFSPDTFDMMNTTDYTSDIHDSFTNTVSPIFQATSAAFESDNEDKIILGESPSTPPLPTSPPPSFEHIQPTDSFVMMTETPNTTGEGIGETTEKTLQTTGFDVDEYEVILNDDDLMRVSSELKEMSASTPDTSDTATIIDSKTQAVSVLGKNEELHDDKYDSGSDIVSISDDSEENTREETEIFHDTMVNTKSKDSTTETNTKVIVSPKINFDDNDDTDDTYSDDEMDNKNESSEEEGSYSFEVVSSDQ